MARSKIKKDPQRKRKKYSQENSKLALQEIKKGMSKKIASKLYNVPRTTLIFQLKNPGSKDRPGPPTTLTVQEENELVVWIKENSRKGFPRRKEDLIASVSEFLKKAKRSNPFKDGIPRNKWYELFMKRHPELTMRTPESVTAASSCVAENDIRKWFSEIENYLKENQYMEILSDPGRVLNGDETNFLLCPKSGRVLAIKGDKNVYEVDQGQAKSCLTVMFTFKADGSQTPPLVIYPNKRLPKDITSKVPTDWGIGLSENGWMKTEIFVDYVKNVLHPHLVTTGTVFPVILFVDGHKTHVTLSVSDVCTELQIILIALYPNSTRILQPADVSAFKTLKSGWKSTVQEWRRTNESEALTKTEFAPLLEIALKKSICPDTLINDFRATGLHPWNPDNIDFSKCLGKQKQDEKKTITESTTSPTITMTRQQFQQIVKENGAEDKENLLKTIFSYFQIEFPLEKPKLPNAVTEIEDLDINELSFLIMDDNKESESQSQSFIQIVHDVEIHEMRETHTSMTEQDKQALDRPNENQDFMDIIETLPETPYDMPTATYIKELKEEDKCETPVKSSRTPKLKDVLTYAKTPIRKGLKTIERKPFVLTSKKWQESERAKLQDKKKKLEDIKKRKEERLLKKNQKNESKKKKEIPESKKIRVLSDITLTKIKKNIESKLKTIPETKKINVLSDKLSIQNHTASIKGINQETTKGPQVFRTPEKIEKVKSRLFFDEKKAEHRREKNSEIKVTKNKRPDETKVESNYIPKTGKDRREDNFETQKPKYKIPNKTEVETTYIPKTEADIKENKPEIMKTKDTRFSETKVETKSIPKTENKTEKVIVKASRRYLLDQAIEAILEDKDSQ